MLEVTDGVLPILGVTPFLGRLFTRADDAPGSPETMILTYGYWLSRLGGDPAAIGRRILVNGRAHEVIGVLPPSFRFLDSNASAFLPLQLDRSKTFLGNFSYQSLARLAPGVAIESAASEMARLIPIAIKAFPAFPGFSGKMFDDAASARRCVR